MVAYRARKVKGIQTKDHDVLGQSVVDLSKYVEDEFAEVARALQATDKEPVLNVAPPKPRAGTIAVADGTNWNPGNGEGPYYYDQTGTWKPLTPVAVTVPGPSTTLPLMDGTAAVGTSLLYARADHVHPTDTSRMAVAGGQTITGGFNFTPANLGTISSGTLTPNPLTANYQYYTNNGAHTIAVPGSDCAIDILMTNGASAVIPTFSGSYTVASGNTGDALTATSASKFIISIRRINAISTYVIKALQ